MCRGTFDGVHVLAGDSELGAPHSWAPEDMNASAAATAEESINSSHFTRASESLELLPVGISDTTRVRVWSSVQGKGYQGPLEGFEGLFLCIVALSLISVPSH